MSFKLSDVKFIDTTLRAILALCIIAEVLMAPALPILPADQIIFALLAMVGLLLAAIVGTQMSTAASPHVEQ